MTAPTSDRAPLTRAEKIKALDEAMIPTGLREMARERFATVLVDTLAPDTERLGGGEREGDAAGEARSLRNHSLFWAEVNKNVFEVLDQTVPSWNTHGFWIERAGDAIRTLAQTAKDATARAETAERDVMLLTDRLETETQWHAVQREQNATLRAQLDAKNEKTAHDEALMDKQAMQIVELEAQLDAMTGREVRWDGNHGWQMTALHVNGRYVVVACRDGMDNASTYASADDIVFHNQSAKPHRAALEALRHPSPAARVVGALSVHGDRMMFSIGNMSVPYPSAHFPEGEYELYIRPALTPNADGAK